MLSNYSDLIKTYKEKQKELQTKRWRLWITITLFSAAVSAAMYFLIAVAEVFITLLLVFSGISIVLFIISVVLKKTISEKPLLTYMYGAVIDSRNFNSQVRISYNPYPKAHSFVEDGGLFPRIATKQVRFSMEYILESGLEIRVYDAYLFNQSDKSRYVYFDGLYLVFNSSQAGYFQLRADGGPKLKGMSFQKIQTDARVKEYVESAGTQRIPAAYYEIYNTLNDRYPESKIYFGATPLELHIGISKYPLFRKMKICTKEEIDNLSGFIDDVVMLSQEISGIAGNGNISISTLQNISPFRLRRALSQTIMIHNLFIILR
ncbi:MAG: hypothetical protein HN368_08340 [Spirochaetales bacterium]|jgi:hypothetical protein|nr:hypothetical protein [Spirochaetales bacterium]